MGRRGIASCLVALHTILRLPPLRKTQYVKIHVDRKGKAGSDYSCYKRMNHRIL